MRRNKNPLWSWSVVEVHGPSPVLGRRGHGTENGPCSEFGGLGGGLLGNTRITRVQAPSNSNKNIMIKVSGFNQCNTQHIPISSYLMLTLILVSASIRLVFLSSFTSFFFFCSSEENRMV